MLTENINYVPLQNLFPEAWRKSRKNVCNFERKILSLFPPLKFSSSPTFNEMGSQPHYFSMSLELLAVLHLLSLIKCPWLSNWNGSSQTFWNYLILLEILKSFIWSRWLCSITPSLALCFDESNQPTINGDLKRIIDSISF